MSVSIMALLTYLSLPIIAIRYAASRSQVVRYYLNLVLYLSTMGLCSVWGVILSIALSLAGNRFNINYYTARSFYFLASKVTGITFKVQGEEYLDTRPAVIVGNHQSMVDILYLGRSVVRFNHLPLLSTVASISSDRIFPQRASIMAKKELQWSPLLGQYMSLSGAVFVDRGNNKTAVQSLHAAGQKMKSQNTSLWLFPEGTRSMREENTLLPFKKGAFHLAVQSGLPVIPVVCENYWRLYRKGVFTSGVLNIRVLPPIPTTSLTSEDVGDLTTQTRDIMIKALAEISHTPATHTTNPTESQPATAPTTTTTIPATGSSRHEDSVLESDAAAESPRKRTVSLASSKPDAGTETEDDDVVLVHRP